MSRCGRRLAAALLATLLAGGCDQVFEPLQVVDDAAFSMVGYLDLYADTQWVRVMPINRAALLGPEPIDAVVTLEHIESGRVVTLRDSVFGFPDQRLDAVAYVHDFWTTEPLEPRASYRLRAERPDGAATTAVVTMPDELRFTMHNDLRVSGGSTAILSVTAQEVPYVEVLNWLAAGVRPHEEPQRRFGRTGDAHDFSVEAFPLEVRQEVRVTATPAGWPFSPEDSDLSVALPGRSPTNVEGGDGFVGGVARATIPYHRCEVVVPKTVGRSCLFEYDAGAASIAGRVVRQPCGAPHAAETVRLIERFADGGVTIRHWMTGWAGEYRFEGIQPGTDLTVEVRPWVELETGPLSAPPVELPRLAAGQRYEVADISVATGC